VAAAEAVAACVSAEVAAAEAVPACVSAVEAITLTALTVSDKADSVDPIVLTVTDKVERVALVIDKSLLIPCDNFHSALIETQNLIDNKVKFDSIFTVNLRDTITYTAKNNVGSATSQVNYVRILFSDTSALNLLIK
jgi:hypothetical protein